MDIDGQEENNLLSCNKSFSQFVNKCVWLFSKISQNFGLGGSGSKFFSHIYSFRPEQTCLPEKKKMAEKILDKNYGWYQAQVFSAYIKKVVGEFNITLKVHLRCHHHHHPQVTTARS